MERVSIKLVTRRLRALCSTMRGESEGLLGDFMALVASFARKLYGMRSAANKRRLLEQAKEDL